MTPEQVAAAALGGPVKERKAPAKKAAQKKPAKPAKRTATPSQKAIIGRPTVYSQELADRICAMLAEGKSMRTVCLTDEMPGMTTVFMWLRTNELFRKQYDTAKAESADAMAEEMTDIADDGTNDWMEVHDKEGNAVGWKVNGEHVQRSRLRIDTRKWLASKLKPKKYGEKVDLNHGGQEGNPIQALLGTLSGKVIGSNKGED